MKDALIIGLLSVLPRKGFSWTQGAFARKKASRALLNWYVRHYQVNLDEMEGSLEDYPTLAEFFVRPLRAGMREISDAADVVVSPCDGRAVAFGEVQDGSFSIFGGEVPVAELLGSKTTFEEGSFLVIYLAPPDYHRVHFPFSGTLTGFRYLPGHLWPVFPGAVRAVKKLFAKNERLVVYQQDEAVGKIALVMVGAYGVGRIETTFSDLLTNGGELAQEQEFSDLEPVSKGQELGRFNMGSTVILFFEKGRITWNLDENQRVLMGQEIAKLTSGS
jgi:phosphatidylserine decarboxylase